MAGYSGTPLAKKLGIKEGMKICFLNAPAHFADLLGVLPPDAAVLEKIQKGKMDYIHIFAETEKMYVKNLAALKSGIQPAGLIWISWPKKSSKKFQSDLDENKIRAHALASGLVDIKVCAVDEYWSGLKLVIPVKDRK